MYIVSSVGEIQRNSFRVRPVIGKSDVVTLIEYPGLLRQIPLHTMIAHHLVYHLIAEEIGLPHLMFVLLQPCAETDYLGNGTLATALRADEHIHLLQPDVSHLYRSHIMNYQPLHKHILVVNIPVPLANLTNIFE